MRSRCEATSAGRIFSATLRSSLVSPASHTSPIPPAPSGEIISYGPKRTPGPILIVGSTAEAFRQASGPIAEEFNVIRHLFRRLSGDQSEQSAHLLADRVILLLGEDDPSM